MAGRSACGWRAAVAIGIARLTGLPPAGQDDLMLEPGLVSLNSPHGLNEAILEPNAEKENSGEDLQDQELELDEQEVAGRLDCAELARERPREPGGCAETRT